MKRLNQLLSAQRLIGRKPIGIRSAIQPSEGLAQMNRSGSIVVHERVFDRYYHQVMNKTMFHQSFAKTMSADKTVDDASSGKDAQEVIIYSHQVYALTSESDYDRIIPDSIEDKQEIIDLNRDIRNVLNYVFFLAFEEKSSEMLSNYQEHLRQYGKDKLIGILKLHNDGHKIDNLNEFDHIDLSSFKTHDEMIDFINSYCQAINKFLNAVDEVVQQEIREENTKDTNPSTVTFEDMAIVDKHLEVLNQAFKKMYDMIDLDPLDDDVMNTEHEYPIVTYLKNRKECIRVTKELNQQSVKDIVERKKGSPDDLLEVCHLLQKRALLYMSTIELNKAFTEIAIITSILPLIKADSKDIHIVNHLIGMQNELYLHLLLKEYIILVKSHVDFDFTLEDPKLLHHTITDNFKLVTDTQEVILSIPLMIPLLTDLSLQFMAMAHTNLYKLLGLIGIEKKSKFKFIEIYEKDFNDKIKILRRKMLWSFFKKMVSFTITFMLFYMMFKFIYNFLKNGLSTDSFFSSNKN